MENNNKSKYVVNKYQLQQVLKSRLISSGSKLVLLHLKSFLYGKDYCFPSQQTIANNLGLSQRQVRNHITALKKVGFIKVKRSAYNPHTQKSVTSNKYDLNYILQKKENKSDEEI